MKTLRDNKSKTIKKVNMSGYSATGGRIGGRYINICITKKFAE